MPSYSDRFRQRQDEIVGCTGNTTCFETAREVRKYFTVKNMKAMFPGERIPDKDDLEDFADLVIEFKKTSASSMWVKK